MEAGPTITLSNSLLKQVSVAAPSGNGVKGVIINNQSGYVLTVTGSVTKEIPPWVNDYLPVGGGPGSESFLLNASSAQINGSVSTPQIVSSLVNIQDSDPLGYPVANPLGAIAAIAGAVTTVQGQVIIATAISLTATPSSNNSITYVLPTNSHINAIGFDGDGAEDFGIIVMIVGVGTGHVYYLGRPFANDSLVQPFYGGAAAEGFRFIVPFPGDLEGGVKLQIYNGAPSGTQGIQFGYLYGFTGSVPPFDPSERPVVTGSGIGSASSGAPATLVAAPSGGRSVRLWTAAIQNLTSGQSSIEVAPAGGGPAIYQMTATNQGSVSFPRGYLVTPGLAVLLTSAATCNGQVTYDYA